MNSLGKIFVIPVLTAGLVTGPVLASATPASATSASERANCGGYFTSVIYRTYDRAGNTYRGESTVTVTRKGSPKRYCALAHAPNNVGAQVALAIGTQSKTGGKITFSPKSDYTFYGWVERGSHSPGVALTPRKGRCAIVRIAEKIRDRVYERTIRAGCN